MLQCLEGKKFDKAVEKLLEGSIFIAETLRHEYVTAEHVLAGLVEIPEIEKIFKACRVDLELLKSVIIEYLNDRLESFDPSVKITVTESVGFEELIFAADKNSTYAGKAQIDCFDILIAFLEIECFASRYLQDAIPDRMQLYTEISKLDNSLDGIGNENFGENLNLLLNQLPELGGGDSNSHLLEKYTVNLVEMAGTSQLGTVVGREKEVKSAIQTLCRKTKNSVIFTGEPGVGKTSVVELLAQYLAFGPIPEELYHFQIYSIDMALLVSGTGIRGEYEKRVKKLIQEAIDCEYGILFIDDIQCIVNSGQNRGEDGQGIAAILKPVLSRGKIRCIGTITNEDYSKIFEKDKALARCFQKIEVSEPTRKEAVEICKGISVDLEQFHKVKFSKGVIEKAVDISIQYMPEKHLPDKAIDILDEACSYTKINEKQKLVTSAIIKKIASKMAKVPLEDLNTDTATKLQNLEADLNTKIFGQEDAISRVVKSVKKSKAGFRNPDKPEGSFLFVGPTGVGKTELVKILSENLDQKLIRFDMSEFQEKHTVSRFLGSPNGYIGSEEGGQLTEAIRKDPFAVVLFDEIEKAHPQIFNVLLQILDYGTVTDQRGRKGDFRNAIIIMTSNVGMSEAEKTNSVGFGVEKNANSREVIEASLKETFSPEFRNRLDGIIYFNALNIKVAESIARREVKKISERMLLKKIKLSVTDQVIDAIVKKGYSPEFGGRNIARTAEDLISDTVMDEVLFGKFKKGGEIKLDYLQAEDKVIFC